MIHLEFTPEQRIEMKRQTAQYKTQVNSRLKRCHERFATDMITVCRKLNITPVVKSDSVNQYDEIQRIISAQELDMRTCDLCGKQCASVNRMMDHRNTKACQETQAEKRGDKYVDPAKVLVKCSICNIKVMQRNYKRHLVAERHLKNAKGDDSCCCKVCNITFNGRRPKRDLIVHQLMSKRHLKKVQLQVTNLFHEMEVIIK
jgi:hypothetical protein